MQKQDNAKKYSRIRECMSIISIPYGLAFLFLMILFLSGHLVSWVDNITSIRYLKVCIYSILFLFSSTIFKLPLVFYSGYILEHKFKLSTENILSWLKFQLKGLLFALSLGVPTILLFYFILDSFPRYWWIITATCSFIISLIMGYILPFIVGFFYKLNPLNNEELKNKIKHIIQKGGLKLEGVYRIRLGARTKKANATLVGIGKTKRVFLSDTLLESDFTEDEITSVTAHEVGHYVYRHILKFILLQLILNYGFLYIIYISVNNVIELLSFGNVNNIINFPVILLIFTLLNILIEPFNNLISRIFEYQSDYYVALNAKTESYVSSLNKLAKLNLVDKDPPVIFEALFHSHPSIKHRIERVEKTTIKA